MTANRVTVDGAALTHDGADLVDTAADIVTDLRDLAGKLTGLGAAWGGDDLGTPFGTPYLELVDQVVLAVLSYQDQIAGTGTALSAGAANFDAAAQRNTARGKALGAAASDAPAGS